MKTMRISRPWHRSVAALLLMLVAGWQGAASAAVVGISNSVTTVPLVRPNTSDAALVSFTAGAIEYESLTHFAATAVNNNNQPFEGSANVVTITSADTALVLSRISSPYLTQGKANASSVTFSLGQTLSAGHAGVLFMYELNTAGQAGDAVTVVPLSNGSPIGSWSLSIASSAYGVQTDLFDVKVVQNPVGTLSNVGVRGVTFTLADFTGDVGTLTGVDGLRFLDGSGGWDPITVGLATTAVIPEPGVLALLAALSAAGLRRR